MRHDSHYSFQTTPSTPARGSIVDGNTLRYGNSLRPFGVLPGSDPPGLSENHGIYQNASMNQPKRCALRGTTKSTTTELHRTANTVLPVTAIWRCFRGVLLAMSVACAIASCGLVVVCGLSYLAGPWACYWDVRSAGDLHLMAEPGALRVFNCRETTSAGYPAPVIPVAHRGAPPPKNAHDWRVLEMEAHYCEIMPSGDRIWSVALPSKPLFILLPLACLLLNKINRHFTSRIRVELSAPNSDHASQST
jgi:hypothetical protein